jgi:AAA+ ATPase superfamily predicted ATPase
MENPFSDYGLTIHGSRFIGRKAEIQAIRNRVFGKRYGNLAIIGLPRIGKSSLAQQAIVEYQKDHPQENILPVWVSMGDFKNSDHFFESMLEAIHDAVHFLKNIDSQRLEVLTTFVQNGQRKHSRL